MIPATEGARGAGFATRRHVIAHSPALDGVRGIAILLVLAHHFTLVRPEGGLGSLVRDALSTGWMGVDLFFVLSGFLITGILIDTRGSDRYFTSFYARRTLRIFPLYYLVVFISFVVLPALPRWHALLVGPLTEPRSLDYWLYVSNFAIADRGAFQHGILDVSWSLAIEEQFYIVWAAIVWLCPSRFLGGVCAGLIVAVPWLRHATLAGGASPIDAYVITPFRADALVWGGLAAWIVRAGVVPRLSTVAPWAFVIGAAGVLAVFGIDGTVFWDGAVMQRLGYSLIAMTGAAAILSVVGSPAGRAARWLSNPVLARFGTLSYCLYLIHLPVMRTVRAFVIDPVAHAEAPAAAWAAQGAFYVLSTTAALAIAHLSWVAFEAPLLRLKRYFPY